MSFFKAIYDSFSGTLADQWKEVVTAGPFDEHTVVAPGVLQAHNRERGQNNAGSVDFLSNGSYILVPENTAAFISSQGGIEQIITQPGNYIYQGGVASIFEGGSLSEAILNQAGQRMQFGGETPLQTRICFVNLREIRNIKFGTRSPLVYNDSHYGVDLEIIARGSFSVRVVDPERFIRQFVPPNVLRYSFGFPKVREQIIHELLQSLSVALNTLSSRYRISQIPGHTNHVTQAVRDDGENAGTWPERFGFIAVKIALESVEFSEESRSLVRDFNARKMDVKAYDGISQEAASIAAQQKIAEGIRERGFGDGAGMIFGMNFAQSLDPQNASLRQAQTPTPQEPPRSSSDPAQERTLEEKARDLTTLKQLVKDGILTDEEFDIMKKKILGL